MAPTNSTFFDTDYPELRKAISDIIESIAQSPQEEKGKLFEALSEQVRGMNLKDLGLAINDQGLQKEVNKELFIKLMGMFKKVCQTAFLVQLNFQSIWKENIKLRHS